MYRFWRSLKLVLWKNFKLQWRNKTGLLVELLAPLVLFSIVAYVRTKQLPKAVDNVSFAAQALPSAGLPVFLQSVVCGGVSFCNSDDPDHQTPLGRAALILRDDPDLQPENLRDLLDNVTETLDDLNRTLVELRVDYVEVGGLSQALVEQFDDLDLEVDTIADTFNSITNGSEVTNNTEFSRYFQNEQEGFRQLIRDLCNWYKRGQFDTLLNQSVADPVDALQDQIDDQVRNGSAGAINIRRLLEADDPVEQLLADIRQTEGFVNDYVPDLLDGYSGDVVSRVQDELRNSGNLSTTELRNRLRDLNLLNGTDLNNLIGVAEDTDIGGLLDDGVQRADLDSALDQLRNTQGFNEVFVPALLGDVLVLSDTQVSAVQDALRESANQTADQLLDRLQGLDGINDTVIGDLVDVGRQVDFQNVSTDHLIGNISEALGNSTAGNAVGDVDADTVQTNLGDMTTRLNSSVSRLVEDFNRLREETNRTEAVIAALRRVVEIPEIQALFEAEIDSDDTVGALQDAVCPSAMGSSCANQMTFYGNAWEQRRARRQSAQSNADETGDTSTGDTADPPSDRANLDQTSGQVQSQLVNKLLKNLTILYAPKNADTDNIIKLANKTFEEMATMQQLFDCLSTLSNVADDAVPSNYTYVPALSLDAWQGFDTVDEMIDEAMRRPAADVVASIEFDNVDVPEAQLSYSIRMHYRKIPSTKKYQSRYQRPGTGGNQGGTYYYSAFVWIQDMIDRAFTDLQSEEDVWRPPEFLRPFPVKAYRRDNFAWGIGRMFPLLMTLAWIYTVAMVCKSVVHEKETRLKEYMKIMGMGSGVHWLGWFITKLCVVTVTVIMLTAILREGKVVEHSDPTLLFFLLEIFGIATIIFSFLLSTFFSKARLAAACGGIVYFVFYFPYVFLTRHIDTMSRAEKFAACSLSTTSFGLAADYLGKFEEMGVGVQWDTVWDGLNACDNFSIGDCMWMLFIDCVWMMAATLYMEAVFPGEYGIPLPWYFFASQSYWRGQTPVSNVEDIDTTKSAEEQLSGPQYEPVQPGKKGVSIRMLTKKYASNECHLNCIDGEKNTSIAVNEASLDMAEGQITSLLGHNGAGKTTTMSMLCGLFPPTSGTAYINGLSIRTDMPEIRSSLGICPQYNVLFDKLTVYECLWFCARLKGMAVELIDDDITTFLGDLGFADKRDVYTENLSGGMKRKLSVAMAFIGGSKVVILDEPTAGMDPSARRSTWDLLLRYKQNRTLMLTTHHMDEADLLSDRVAIIAKGVVRCIGSSLFLKTAYGAGYTVTLELSNKADRDKIDELVATCVPRGKLVDSTDLSRAFVLPCKDQPLYAGLFTVLENAGAELGVTGYGVTATSLEEVFIKVAEMAEDDDDSGQPNGTAHSASLAAIAAIDGAQLPPIRGNPPLEDADGGYMEVGGAEARLDTGEARAFRGSASASASARLGACVPDPTASAKVGPAAKTSTTRLNLTGQPDFGKLHTGGSLWKARFHALLRKRALHSLRDRKAVMAQIILPAVFVLMGMWVATNFPPGTDEPALDLMWDVPLQQGCAGGGGKNVETHVPFVDMDNSTYGAELLRSFDLGAPGFDASQFRNLSGDSMFLQGTGSCGVDCMYEQNMTSYLLDSHEKEDRFRRIAVSVTDAHDPWIGLSLGDLEDPFTTTAHAWYDNRAYHGSPISLGVTNNAILRANSKASNPSIRTKNHPVPKTTDDKLEQYATSLVDLLVAINVMIALSFIPASFVLFLVQERVSKSKHLQFVSGVQPTAYWLSSYCWDSINFLLPLVVTVIVFIAYELPAYTGRNLPVVTMLMLLYGLAITPAMYPFNWCFNVPSTAYVVLIVANLFLGLTCTLAISVLELFQEDDPGLYEVGELLKQIFMFFPQFCLGRGLIEIATNEYIDQFASAGEELIGDLGDNIPRYRDPFEWDIAGRFLFALAVEAVGFFLVTLALEFVFQRRKKSTTSLPVDAERNVKPLAPDVAAERTRMLTEDETTSSDVLRVCGLSKIYKSRGQKKLAVDQLFFGVPKGQCFGLLGVNGAGKTTTFKMLTGDISLSGGDAQVAGFSVRRGQGLQVKQNLGYCPQFDALDPFLTGRQTLFLYARLRGIPEKKIAELVDWTVERLQLDSWADRITREYSGGNKRKLSVAIGMIGNPPVLFLDEPTSGMDPRARRFLWDMITATTRAGRCIILTSHSMEECDALCSRLAIMVNGQFQCMGSPQHLKNSYGDGYSLILQVTGIAPDLAPVKRFMEARFKSAELKEAHHGYIRYHMPREGLPPLSQIFTTLEAHKVELKLEDYSVSQTSLDEIFCNFAKLQDSDRNDKKSKKAKKKANPKTNAKGVKGVKGGAVLVSFDNGAYESEMPVGEEDVSVLPPMASGTDVVDSSIALLDRESSL